MSTEAKKNFLNDVEFLMPPILEAVEPNSNSTLVENKTVHNLIEESLSVVEGSILKHFPVKYVLPKPKQQINCLSWFNPQLKRLCQKRDTATKNAHKTKQKKRLHESKNTKKYMQTTNQTG